VKKTAVLFFLVFLTFNLFAKKEFYNVELHFTNGDIKSGYATPIFPPYTEKILYKASLKNKPIKIDADELSKAVYKFDNGNERTFVRLKTYKGTQQKNIKRPYWYEMIIDGYVSLYSVPIKVGSTNPYSCITNITELEDYYCKRPGESAATKIASSGNNTIFKKQAQSYFSDCEELTTKIKNKEYKWKDLEEVIGIYNDWKAAQEK